MRLSLALIETGLVVKEGSAQTSGEGGPSEMTSHKIWVDEHQNVHAYYTNGNKFLATFLLKVFPTENVFDHEVKNGATDAEALLKTMKRPTHEQTSAYKHLLRHDGNQQLYSLLWKFMKRSDGPGLRSSPRSKATFSQTSCESRGEEEFPGMKFALKSLSNNVQIWKAPNDKSQVDTDGSRIFTRGCRPRLIRNLGQCTHP